MMLFRVFGICQDIPNFEFNFINYQILINKYDA